MKKSEVDRTMAKRGNQVASMTGFGRAEGADDAYRWAWELRSVNGRGLDMRLRVGMGFERLDPEIRKRLSTAFKRGSLTASLDVRALGEVSSATINRTLLDELEALCRDRGQDPALDRLLAVRGVIDSGEDRNAAAEDDDRCKAVLATLEEAIAAMAEARRVEGIETERHLSARVDEIADLVNQANGLDATRLPAIRDRLLAQVDELLGDGREFNRDRLEQEVALLATKADIREELNRLSGHVDQARSLLSAGGPVGRKLDFLTQEFNREANTLCSKSSDKDLTNIGLAMKAAIDQMREQAANLE